MIRTKQRPKAPAQATTGSSDYADDAPSSEQLGSVFQGGGGSQKEGAKTVIQDALDKSDEKVS